MCFSSPKPPPPPAAAPPLAQPSADELKIGGASNGSPLQNIGRLLLARKSGAATTPTAAPTAAVAPVAPLAQPSATAPLNALANVGRLALNKVSTLGGHNPLKK